MIENPVASGTYETPALGSSCVYRPGGTAVDRDPDDLCDPALQFRTALRNESEIAAVHLAELVSGTFADMGEISLANVARVLDSTLDAPMTAQARIVAHLVEAAESAGYDAPRIIEILDAIIRETVLDEFWITDDEGFFLSDQCPG